MLGLEILGEEEGLKRGYCEEKEEAGGGGRREGRRIQERVKEKEGDKERGGRKIRRMC